MSVRRAHHGDLDLLIAKTGNAPGPFAFDHGPSFEFKAKFGKEINRRIEILDDDSHIIHTLKRHSTTRPLYRQVPGREPSIPNMAPCGSRAVTAHMPPGTSIGGTRIAPPPEV